MTVCSYSLKIPANKDLWKGISRFSSLTTKAAQEVLNICWTTVWIDKVSSSTLKSYKIIGEEQVQVVELGQMIYLPSRIRRGIAEWVGRTLRSQSTRKDCFNHLKVVLQDLDIKQNLDKLIPQVFYTIRLQFGVYYKYQVLRQVLRMIRRYTLKYNIDITLLEYTSLVHPKLSNFTFPYGADDTQALKMEQKGNSLHLEMKLPQVDQPYGPKDWSWCSFTLAVPPKIAVKLQGTEHSAPKKPDLRYKRLKSGLLYPILQVPWECTNQRIDYTFYSKKRVLAVDLGLVNLTTSVICEAGSQITPPIFYKRASTVLNKIERLYELQSSIQKKLSKRRAHAPGQARRQQELTRIHSKLKRKQKEEVSLTVKHLVQLAQYYGCSMFALEDLRSISPPRGMKKWSRRLNNWFHGELYEFLTFKATFQGLKVKLVNPRGTSSYCPRCGKKGTKVVDSESKEPSPFGRYFYCQHCLFTGDRDYVGALNVYRLYDSYCHKKYSMASSRTVLYTSIGLPLNRSSGILLS